MSLFGEEVEDDNNFNATKEVNNWCSSWLKSKKWLLCCGTTETYNGSIDRLGRDRRWLWSWWTNKVVETCGIIRKYRK